LRSKYFRNQNSEEDAFESKRKKLFSSLYKFRKLTATGKNWSKHLNMHNMEELDKLSNLSGEMNEENNEFNGDFFNATYYKHQNRTKSLNNKG
jgi:hypothetical protein